MPDLAEHGSIDEIAAHAVAVARRDASVRPLPELRLRRTGRWVAPVLAFATLVAVVAGLVAIGTDRDGRASRKPPDVHWLLRDVPAGWRPISAYDSTTAPPPSDMSDQLLPYTYVSDDQPLGPTLSVLGTTDTSFSVTLGSYSFNAVAYEELEIDGKRAAFADIVGGGRALYVEVDGAWAYLVANGLDDGVLLELAGTLAPDATGHFDVSDGALPDGMREIPFNGERPTDSAEIGYAGDQGGTMHLSVGTAMPDFLGRSSVGFDVEPITVDGFSGFIGGYGPQEAQSFWLVVWQREGLDFALSAHDVSREQAVAAAVSASPASAAEWAQLNGILPVQPDDTAAPVETEPEDPATTANAPSQGEVRDVDVAVSVVDVSDNEQRWSGVLPTGETWSADVLRLYDLVDVRMSIDGIYAGGSYGTQISWATNGVVACCSPMAITTDPDAVALRVVRSNGDRYTIPLHELPGTDVVRIALFPFSGDDTQAELVDADGIVIES